jgi:iron complex transport system ATP-binding protein
MTSLVAHLVALDGRLSPTDLEVRAGELVAVIGPNGGGKTSLLRAIARIESAGGKVEIDIFAVRDVIALGLDRPDDSRIESLIAQFELEGLAERPVNRLSTGERARVLTARALAARPGALLLDEPLSNLDP